MSLNLSNIFEIVYPNNLDSSSLEKLKNRINNLKVDNLLNLNKKRLSKYLLFVSDERNVIDFRIDPKFEIVNMDNEIYNAENHDFHIINEGSEPIFHDNFHTNININVFQNKNVSNQISIKKVLQSLNYPDNLLDEILNDNENEDYVLNNLIHDYDSESDNEEFVTCENEITSENENICENKNENTSENENTETTNSSKYIEVKTALKRKTHLDSFGFNIICNQNNFIVITEVKENSVAHKKLLVGDIIKTINNIPIVNLSTKKIVEVITSNLKLNLIVLRNKDQKINYSNETYFRIVGNKYLKLYLFKKEFNIETQKFDTKKLSLVSSVFLCDTITYPKILDSDENSVKSYIEYNTIFTKNYYDLFSVDYGESEYLQSMLNTMDTFSDDFFETLNKIKSGIYLNTNNVLWNIYLSCSILYNFEDTFNFSHLDYKQKNIKQLYFPYYKKEKASIFEKMLVKSMNICCDECSAHICKNITGKYYGSPIYGDLCINCYEKKKLEFNNRISYLKKIILLQGKKAVFKKQLEKTKNHLDKTKIKKIDKSSYMNLLKNINSTILFKSDRKVCNICYDYLDFDNLGVYTKCGHTFHYECIKKMNSKTCPLCRENSGYTKLFI